MSWHCATNASHEAKQAIEFADCETFNFENTLPADLTEAQSGYAQELAAIDMSILPETIDISELSALRRAIVAYMLEIKLEDLGDTLHTDTLDETDLLSKALLGAFAKAQVANQDGFDFHFFRRGIHHYYSCARGFPLTLEGFYQHYGAFDTATSETVDSAPKAGPRRLSHLAHAGIFRAESLKDNETRETEFIIAGHRTDDALDFVTYDQNGDLVSQSEFASSTGQLNLAATPYACMTCHRDQNTQAFNIINPDDVD
ncbi:MAG: hypothetical protein QGI45_01475 [Myxococcota bacterium]|nr:hypothetical protein [Myxococcota bacterium]